MLEHNIKKKLIIPKKITQPKADLKKTEHIPTKKFSSLTSIIYMY